MSKKFWDIFIIVYLTVYLFITTCAILKTTDVHIRSYNEILYAIYFVGLAIAFKLIEISRKLK